MNSFKIFVVEDDPWYGEMLLYHLRQNPDFEVTIFKSGKECLSSFYKQPDLITIDFSLPDMTGDDLFKAIRKVDAKVPIIVISSQEDIKVAVGMMKMGVADYLVKGENTQELLWNSILRIKENLQLKEEVETLREELGQKYSFEKSIIGQSRALKKVFSLMNRAIETSINVSITGETGTGKELVAKAIHFNGSRKRKKFIPVNMGAIPKELIESELFGHEKGAFTGAIGRKIGKFEEANGGTIFLDEIAELDLNLQSKLLRVLQEREVVRVGSNEAVPLDIRIITATHRDLREIVKKGGFREDLYFRLIGLPINVPPLREREGDIPILINHFLREFAKENRTNQTRISNAAIEKLMRYSFPGNVRELKATIDLAAVICSDNVINESDITYFSSDVERLFFRENKTLREYTRNIIQHFFEKNEGDVLKTADELDIGKSKIYKMIKEGEIG
ncbi:sigma-54 dependent transcriptional regulator [Jiulongibacter sediminis]|uniref:sigma-54-dependent transcriptional regulator n=1 Tax=Jiulongibacter sediminis TaxID=1605367 RepID=UPI0026F0B4A3|nr:sigma-54 dependent transcriptional regulator [Jiulongibacter sediminis]